MKSLANIVRKKEEKRFEPEGSEKYKEMNSNVKRFMKKTKENWTRTVL